MLKHCLVAAGLVGALVAGASAANAQASRTWVSGVGDDANPCSRTAPCKTFAGAISKTAAKGEINALDPGGFGGLTITKSISVEAEGVTAGVLVSGTNGIVVNAGASDIVTIRGLTIEGLGTGLNGIRILNAGTVHIENCTIQNFVNRGIDIQNAAANVQVIVRNTVIKNNFLGGTVPAGNSGGILVRPANGFIASVVIDDSTIDQNTIGIRAENNGVVIMRGGSLSMNLGFGAIAVTTGGVAGSIALHGTNVSKNSTGVQGNGTNAVVRISDTIITQNSTGVSTANSGQVVSFGNNSIGGNGVNGTVSSTTPQQ